MDLDQLFAEIESLQFEIRFTVLSGFNSVKRAMQDDETVQQLIRELQVSAENRQPVFDRLMFLLNDNSEPQYLHKHEEAMLAYLFALIRTDISLAQAAARQILWVPNLFWAKKLAQELWQLKNL